jgi:hypothetical protein
MTKALRATFIHPRAAKRRRVAVTALVLVLSAGVVPALQNPFTLLFYLSFALMGGILVIRQPRNTVGWLLIGIGFGFIGTTTGASLDAAALTAGTAGPRDVLMAWLAGWSDATFILLFALMVVFPSGRLPEGRWRRPTQAVLVIAATLIILTAVAPTVTFYPNSAASSVAVPNPFTLLPALSVWSLLPSRDALLLPIISLLVIGVVSMSVRYRRSRGITRLQLRWLVAALSLTVAAVVVAVVLIALVGDRIGGLVWAPITLAVPTIPIAIAVAVMRYRLFEIDRLISRTISYSVVSLFLISVFGGCVVLLSGILASVAQAQTIAVAASTLAVFALFSPVLRRVRHAIDRRFDRARYDSDRTADAFGRRLRDEVDLASVMADLSATTGTVLAPTTIGVWIRPPATRS